jgi:hypothetical protein
MPLSEEETRTYRQTLEVAQRQLEEIDQQIERELSMVKERLAALQERRPALCLASRWIPRSPSSSPQARWASGVAG